MNTPTKHFSETVPMLAYLLKWLLIALAVSVAAGSASAALLASLDWATAWRESHLWILLGLPPAGFAVGWLYLKYGRDVERGNNLLIDEIHDPRTRLPRRMTPMIFLGTVASHLFGASVGREGSAVQMGGTLADQLALPLRLDPEERRILIMCGISAGFGSIFGVPMSGALFGLEVLSIGKLRYNAIFPCFVASLCANLVTKAWGIHHSVYQIGPVPDFGLDGMAKALAAGAAFGLVAMAFARTTHALSAFAKRLVPYAPMRPFWGGCVVLMGTAALGSTAYLGLGLPAIAQSFSGQVRPFDFLGKFLFTTLSLGAGFKGGEVTPLFYIGATLGNALAPLLALPAPLMAGMGFVAVFAGAANTPLASTFMAFELFGPQAGVFAGLACVASYLFSGHAGIYSAQRLGQHKYRGDNPAENPPLVDL
ncbi:MAG TPA: chloride channel protein [bacterium]|jgi:H+/Cl- antiporter ClcA|nr:chloride channel protein [bacterium]